MFQLRCFFFPACKLKTVTVGAFSIFMPPVNSYSFAFTRLLFCLLKFQNLKPISLAFFCRNFCCYLAFWLKIIAVFSTEFSLSALYKRAHIVSDMRLKEELISSFPFTHSQCRTASEQSMCAKVSSAN